VFNAANEECVAGFLAGNLAFPEIVSTVVRVVDAHLDAAGGGGLRKSPTLADVLDVETWARARANEVLTKGIR